MAPFLTTLESLETRIPPGRRRAVGLLLLFVAGWLDYITGPEIASAPFYILVLFPLAFFETPWICLGFSIIAAMIYLGVDLLSKPGAVTLVYPYWQATARFLSFALISTITSRLVGEQRRLHLSEQALQEKAAELAEKNRRLEDALEELRRLHADLLARERQAGIAEAIFSTTYEIERPLASVSVYTEELLRLAQRAQTNEEPLMILAEIQPLLEKLGERTQNMEAILQGIRELRKTERRVSSSRAPLEPGSSA